MRQSLRENAGELVLFLRTNMRVIPWIVTVIFFMAVGTGYMLYALAPEQGDQIIAYFQGVVDSAGVVNEDGSIELFPLLFNNWRAMLFTIFYGFVPFLFMPITSGLLNASIIGVLASYYQVNGMGTALFLSAIVPHGIFEIPALLISISLGTLLCWQMVLRICRHKNTVPFVELMCGILRTVLMIVFPLVVLAALAETYLTPWVMSLFL